MGLSSTGDKYKLLMDVAFDGIKDMKKFIDDILTYNSSFSEHVMNVRKLLQRCRIHGISIAQKKFIFARKEVKYVGFIVNGNGVKTDSNKVRAIRELPQPTNLTELRSLMGLVNQLAGYSKKFIASALPLRPLLKSRK